MAQIDLDWLGYKVLFISVKDPSDRDLIDSIAKDLKEATTYTATLTYEQQESTEQVQ